MSFTPSCLFNKKTGEQTQAATRFNEFDGQIKHENVKDQGKMVFLTFTDLTSLGL